MYSLPDFGLEGEDEDEIEAEIEERIAADKLIEWDQEPWEDSRRAERFIARINDADRGRRIQRAWEKSGRGRWSRFKGALDGAGLLSDWFTYRRECVRADVIGLLKVNRVAFRDDSGSK